MEIQDLDSLVTELTNKGAYSASKGNPRPRRSDGLRRIKIYYTERSDSVVRERDFEVFDKIVGGTEEEPVYEYSFVNSIPDILRDTPVQEPQREPIYTKQELFDNASTHFKETVLDPEDISIRISGDRDNIRVRVLDKEDMFDDLHFIAYMDKDDARQLRQVK